MSEAEMINSNRQRRKSKSSRELMKEKGVEMENDIKATEMVTNKNKKKKKNSIANKIKGQFQSNLKNSNLNSVVQNPVVGKALSVVNAKQFSTPQATGEAFVGKFAPVGIGLEGYGKGQGKKDGDIGKSEAHRNSHGLAIRQQVANRQDPRVLAQKMVKQISFIFA